MTDGAMRSNQARFDALCELIGFGPDQVQHLRESLPTLGARVGELVQTLDKLWQRPAARTLFGEDALERKEELNALLAGFVLRTLNCVFDEAFCEYVTEMRDKLPAGYLSLGLALACNFATSALVVKHAGDTQLQEAQSAAWSRLTSVLREYVR